MDFKKLIELIESGFDDVQIADAIEFLGDKSASMAELEHDNHMHAIKIDRMQAEIDALKADKEQQHMEIVDARKQGQKYAAENHALRKQIEADAFKNDWRFEVSDKDPVSVYAEDYGLICENDVEYTPTDFERSLIVDALHGYESEQDKEIQALRTNVAALKAAQLWQPIETAPKDGTRILVFIDNGDDPIKTVGERDTDNGCWISSWSGEVLYPPTHWIPLPPAPESAK